MSSTAPSSAPTSLDNLSQREFDEARLALLRRRVSTFAVVVGILLLLLSGFQWLINLAVLEQPVSRAGMVGMLASLMVGAAIIVRQRVKRAVYQRATLRSLVLRTNWIVAMSVLSQIGGATLLADGVTQMLRPTGYEGHLGPIFVLFFFMVVVHTAAAIIVPWTFKEACVAPLVWATITLVLYQFGRDTPKYIVIGTTLSLASGIPGILITLLRASGLREMLGLQLIGARYAEVEHDLAFARRIHERHFPQPVREGPIRLEYAYEPMRQIGGDFIETARAPDGSMLTVMIDVTGHGVAAALAVNRLHGEMKMLLAESRDKTPGAVMAALNRYVNLTLADESVFATGVAVRVWPGGRALICNAGHPLPLLRAANGQVTVMEESSPLLGPFAPDEFVADEFECRLEPGAVLLLYTDGAVECRGTSGAELGQPALERMLASAPELAKLPGALLQGIGQFRSGPAQDDVLIAAVAVG